MAKLITGGTGNVSAELAHILVARGEEVVLFDIVISEYRVEDIKNKVKIVRGDLGNLVEVLNVVKDNNITDIYHIGSMRNFMADLNPWAAMNSNVIGTYNVLEAARMFNVEKVMFTSTGATFGLHIPDRLRTTDTTIQRPTSIYGCGKLFGESLGRWYRTKFGVDFRSIRYPYVVGPNIREPMHWAPQMIEDSIIGEPNECNTVPEIAGPMIYLTDAARAADMVLQAPREDIKMVNYNIAGIPESVSAEELEAILTKRYPKTKVIYSNDEASQKLSRRLAGFKEKLAGKKPVFDDTCARREWGWDPLYTTPEAIIDIFEKDMKDHPKRLGLG